jgi:hypothetical protein
LSSAGAVRQAEEDQQNRSGKRKKTRIYISAYIEGIIGIAHWDEAKNGGADHQEFREYMKLNACTNGMTSEA